MPDVYQASHTFITGFFSLIPKISLLFVLFKILIVLFFPISLGLQSLFLFIGNLSIIIGSLGGINQIKLKRLLAYSTISHIGFVLLAFSCSTLLSFSFSFLYLFLYLFLTLFNFAFILSFIHKNDPHLNDLHFTRHSFFSFSFSFSLLATGGFPPLLGFVSKLFIIYVLFLNSFYLSAFIALIFSIFSLFFYFRFLEYFFFPSFPYLTLRYPSSSSFFYFSLPISFLTGFLF